LGLALVLAAPALAGLQQCGGGGEPAQIQISQQPQGIWVSGVGEVSITPDIATLSLGVETQKATVSEALSESSAAMTNIMKALTDSGIDQKDIQTGNFSIYQRTRWAIRSKQNRSQATRSATW
jgi:uncharacterized protein YggE